MRKEVIGAATLYLGDCREILPTLPRPDALITDPPYGIAFSHAGGDVRGIGGGKYATKFADVKIAGDDAPFDPSALVGAADSVVRWGANHYADKLPPSAHWFIWDKREADSTLDFADCEMAWVNRKGVARIFRHYWNGMLKASERGEARVHPTQKPVALMAWCMGRLGSPQSVLDPFMGSGTTGVACANLGVRFVGIELETTYFDIACRRIEDAQRQGRLIA